jgi:hypothetical protein
MSSVSSIFMAAKLQLLNRIFLEQCAFMLYILEICAQVVTSYSTFRCNKMAKCQSSVLAGNSGDSGRQLRQGSGSRRWGGGGNWRAQWDGA